MTTFTETDPGFTEVDLTGYVNVTLTAADHGFGGRVYIAPDVFGDTVAWDREDAARKPAAPITNAQTRLDTLLSAAWFAAAIMRPGTAREFVLDCVPRAGRDSRERRRTLVLRHHVGAKGMLTIEAALTDPGDALALAPTGPACGHGFHENWSCRYLVSQRGKTVACGCRGDALADEQGA